MELEFISTIFFYSDKLNNTEDIGRLTKKNKKQIVGLVFTQEHN